MRSRIFSGLPSLQGAGAGDFLLFFEHVRRHIFPAEILRIGRRDVHGEIVHQFLEIVGARHEIRFAVDFHQHAELAAGVDVAADQALLGGARGLLAGRRDAVLAQHDFGFADVALGFHQGLLALHHAGAGTLAEFFY